MENLTINQFHTQLTLELPITAKPSSIEFRKVGNQVYKLNLVSNTKTDNGTIIYTYNNSID